MPHPRHDPSLTTTILTINVASSKVKTKKIQKITYGKTEYSNEWDPYERF